MQQREQSLDQCVRLRGRLVALGWSAWRRVYPICIATKSPLSRARIPLHGATRALCSPRHRCPAVQSVHEVAPMKSILIAEGDERVADLFSYIFAREGWTVATYRDGQRAAAALGDRASYDAVLVSNRLLDMGGVALITRIRALDHRKDVPIVMVTGSTDVALVAAALSAGADDVLYKPVDVDFLVDTVNKCVECARRRRE
jgi:CheY-like chemotaxis protein